MRGGKDPDGAYWHMMLGNLSDEELEKYSLLTVESALLKIHRFRFFVRSGLFVVLSALAVVYRYIPFVSIFWVGLFVLLLFWLVDATLYRNDNLFYNAYVEKISPLHAQQKGMNLAPVRGWLSCAFGSWHVTCFYLPFLLLMLSLVVSPSRVSEHVDICDKSIDERVMGHNISRINYIIDNQQIRKKLVCDFFIAIYYGVSDMMKDTFLSDHSAEWRKVRYHQFKFNNLPVSLETGFYKYGIGLTLNPYLLFHKVKHKGDN